MITHDNVRGAGDSTEESERVSLLLTPPTIEKLHALHWTGMARAWERLRTAAVRSTVCRDDIDDRHYRGSDVLWVSDASMVLRHNLNYALHAIEMQ